MHLHIRKIWTRDSGGMDQSGQQILKTTPREAAHFFEVIINKNEQPIIRSS